MSRTAYSRLLDEPIPADAKKLGGLAWVLLPPGRTGKPELKIWFGKSKRPKYYAFANEAAREKYLASAIVSDQQAADAKQAKKLRRIAEADQFAMKIEVGTLLHNSWGYEQTNCDFYQVVRREGRVVWVREICGAKVPGSDGFDSCKMRACPNQFAENSPEIRKVIGSHGVQFEHGYTSITTAEEAHFCSWYG